MRRKKYLPVPIQDLKKGIQLSSKSTLALGLSMNEVDQLSYYKDRLKELESSLKEYKRIINKFSDQKDYYETLKKFRDMCIFNCIVDNNKTMSVFQCGYKIINDRCDFYNKCLPRLDFLKKIGINI